jgi:hypothetical protein
VVERFSAPNGSGMTICTAGGVHVHAVLLLARGRPFVGLMDLSSDGGGHGTRFVDDLVEIALAEGLRGLAFTDASPGVETGAGFWRAYVAKRPHLALEGGAPTLETRLVRAPRAA